MSRAAPLVPHDVCFPRPPTCWAHLPFFATTWPGVRRALADETRSVLPPPHRLFAALEACPPDAVRAVILGQDPYPTPGHADGLAFSVQPRTPLPRSLANVFAELEADQGCRLPDGDLSGWARQGVLLLNTCLTVPAGAANGHRRLGWQRLAAEVIGHVSLRPTAFVLWGRPAQAMARHIDPGDHLVIESPHPSPLSARTGFFGSRPFGQVNDWLVARGETPIDWCRGAPMLPFGEAAR
ncbi:uracil-DNA glycosylase [Roseitranquillus sediminis]|uniref:uracil-DNA glycosylase n=1 Tax=Roseitranquillus sediminis TaxID=2809051 RepID=UPI001D0C9CBD|nr:uracil-DNA glycosylase [Roseitranquillus sediminis]MBM9594427.1 uracil-DNA glycosylase [Roseitranquillus sediminis]